MIYIDHDKRILGDVHNNGAAVSRIDANWIRKPRPVFLEKQFLGSSSFRTKISNLFSSIDLPSPFSWIPTLNFISSNPYNKGYVEILNIKKLTGPVSTSDYYG